MKLTNLYLICNIIVLQRFIYIENYFGANVYTPKTIDVNSKDNYFLG